MGAPAAPNRIAQGPQTPELAAQQDRFICNWPRASTKGTAMPHDATPRNGRMYGSGIPGWVVALVLAVALSAAVTALAVTTGLFIILVPALAAVALGYSLYAAIAARRRRRRFDFGVHRTGVIADGRALRRRARLSGRAP